MFFKSVKLKLNCINLIFSFFYLISIVSFYCFVSFPIEFDGNTPTLTSCPSLLCLLRQLIDWLLDQRSTAYVNIILIVFPSSKTFSLNRNKDKWLSRKSSCPLNMYLVNVDFGGLFLFGSLS